MTFKGLVSTYNKRYQEKVAELQTSIDEANARERQAKEQYDEEQSRIDSLAEEKVVDTKNLLKEQFEKNVCEQKDAYERKMQELGAAYTTKRNNLYALTFGSVLYGFIVTILTAIRSPRFSSDILTALKLIWTFIAFLFEKAILLASASWSLHDIIPYQVLNTIAPGLLAGLSFIAVLGGSLAIIVLILFNIGKFYIKYFADKISVLTALITLALLVWFADFLTFLRWNVIVIFIVVQVFYALIRYLTIRSKHDE